MNTNPASGLAMPGRIAHRAGGRSILRASVVRCGFLLACACAWPGECQGQSGAAEGAIEQGQAVLRDSDFPWYDAEQDKIQRIDVDPPQDVAARKSRWQPANRTGAWPDWLRLLVAILGWILLGAVILALLYALLHAAMVTTGRWRSGAASSTADDPLHGDIDRVEALPFQLKRPQVDLLAQAQRHYEAGEYGQAIIYLYSYQLIQLDRHQLIRLAKGKTNRQYLREVRPRPELRDLLSRSMIAFEDVFFGHHTLDRDRFESCWRKLDEFHNYLTLSAA